MSGAPRGPVPPAPDLRALRRRIEHLDRQLVDIVAERIEIARRVGEVKQAHGLPTCDPAREAAVVRRAGALAREAGLPEDDVRTLFWHLIALSRRQQMEARP